MSLTPVPYPVSTVDALPWAVTVIVVVIVLAVPAGYLHQALVDSAALAALLLGGKSTSKVSRR
ncbi:hypothetical protein ACIQOW_06215 [Kitasatospora sp. NPDC091335]|uniref:hypothetical protein n=1 Tax=Kitasatospora sp. NPDC091335 TaxID=3364085 RepID=UPI0037FBBACE